MPSLSLQLQEASLREVFSHVGDDSRRQHNVGSSICYTAVSRGQRCTTERSSSKKDMSRSSSVGALRPGTLHGFVFNNCCDSSWSIRESSSSRSFSSKRHWSSRRKDQVSSSSLVVRAAAGGSGGRGTERSSSAARGWDPNLELEVPPEQRPVNELAALKETPLFGWAQLSDADFAVRMGGSWLLFFVLFSGPITAVSFSPQKEPFLFLLAGGAGALIPVSLLLLRIYLGWSYVGNRLLSAVIDYEETGWYDGQTWVKPAEILFRDRLIGSYEVTPVIDRLRQLLISCAAILVLSFSTIFLVAPPLDETVVVAPRTGMQMEGRQDPKLTIKVKDLLLRPPSEILEDDDLAAAAAEAAKGRPAYCTDRFYRALAGGQYCSWDDLRQ